MSPSYLALGQLPAHVTAAGKKKAVTTITDRCDQAHFGPSNTEYL
jgi:hypothetical protein